MPSLQNIVAIVDDDPEVRNGLEQLFSSLGYRTELYASAEAFITATSETEASCLVVDVHLGDISGIELGRHLLVSGFAFPTIFMTGSRDETLRKQAMDLGAVAYFHKPFPIDSLIEAVKKAIALQCTRD
jgi:FixJ family two-component response regulator